LRWKLTLAFTSVTAALLAIVGADLRARVLEHTRTTLQERLLAEARMGAELLPPPPWETRPDLQEAVEQLDRRLGARVTLIGPRGGVAADSRHDAAAMENHADRPERLQALREGWGSALRFSATLGLDMLYVALVVPAGGEAGSVLRLALPLTAVEAASRDLRTALVGAFVLAAVVLLGLSSWLAGALTAPVERLVRAARRVGRGDLDARVTEPATGELAELTEVFNTAIDRLAGLVGASQAEARRYGAILEQMSDAVVIVDGRGRVELVNSAFRRLFGADPAEIEGKFVEEIALNYELSQLLTRALEQGAPQRGELRLLYPESRLLVGVVTPLLEGDHQVAGAVGLLHDVTDLDRMDRVRREFVANASHELRTPASGIRALAEVLEGGALQDPERGPDFVQQIVEASDRLTAILDDMLVLTRVERGQELMQPRWLAVREACEDAARHVAQRASDKGIAIGFEIDDAAEVYADPGALQTTLINLVDNAVKYTPSGGKVAFDGRSVPGGYEISVTDTGSGIPEADLERVFERFYRVDRARDRATGGTGLGLAIVKHSVEAHGGRVSVRSTLGEGSTFSVFFPGPQ
jgi:two-component system phosphate regulon sensor histidine kinase PhoR